MKRILAIILNFVLLGVPTLVWAAAIEKASKLEKKIDLAKLGPIDHFFAGWYNDNLWVYALIVTVLMGLMGFLIALFTDVILKMIGMEVHKMEHHE